jgi:hypothetical protein
MDGVAVCGAKPVASESGRSSRCVAVVESLASSSRQQGGPRGRRTGVAAGPLAAARAGAANRSGAGGIAAFGGARLSVRRGIVAAADGKAIGPAIHATSSRSPLEIANRRHLKTPDPFIPSIRMSYKYMSYKYSENLNPYLLAAFLFHEVVHCDQLYNNYTGDKEINAYYLETKFIFDLYFEETSVYSQYSYYFDQDMMDKAFNWFCDPPKRKGFPGYIVKDNNDHYFVDYDNIEASLQRQYNMEQISIYNISYITEKFYSDSWRFSYSWHEIPIISSNVLFYNMFQ